MSGSMSDSRPENREPDRSWVRRALARFTDSSRAREWQALAKDAATSGCELISDCKPRTHVTVKGRLTSVTLTPSDAQNKWLEAELTDGTGTITLIWMGRRSIPGVAPGALVRVQGLLAIAEGHQVIFNPRYELIDAGSSPGLAE